MTDLQGYPTPEALEQTVRQTVQNLPTVNEVQAQTHLYNLNGDIDPIGTFRTARFSTSSVTPIPILHRPEIVDDLMGLVFDPAIDFQGIFVRGPQGVGKSHSLTNLVQALRAKDHLVTFIPDCERFADHYDLIHSICRSMGKPSSFFGLPWNCSLEYLIHVFIPCIVKVTGDLGKFWILVFDQLNRIFARPAYRDVKDVGVLPQPFSLMKTLNRSGSHVCTVIAASVNNDVSYRENHEGFVVYEHPLAMSTKEVNTWKSMECEGYEEQDFKSLVDLTGGIPLQVANRLKSRSDEDYLNNAQGDIRADVRKLFRENVSDTRTTQEITDSAIRCLLNLQVTGIDPVYDRKYSVISSDGLIKPLFPAVLIEYRAFFWDELLQYVASHEAELLAVCANTQVSNDVRGRLFELIVITRFREGKITNNEAKDGLPAKVDAGKTFDSQQLPVPQLMEQNMLFLPKNSNFPAIDLILKDGKDVWGIQVHVVDHPDVSSQFGKMCEASGWLNHFNNIFLVYLGPSREAKDSLTCLPKAPSRSRLERSVKKSKPEIQISTTTIHDYECLKDIQWPRMSGGDNMEVSD